MRSGYELCMCNALYNIQPLRFQISTASHVSPNGRAKYRLRSQHVHPQLSCSMNARTEHNLQIYTRNANSVTNPFCGWFGHESDAKLHIYHVRLHFCIKVGRTAYYALCSLPLNLSTPKIRALLVWIYLVLASST